MSTREPRSIREYVAEHSTKTAADIQAEIELMRRMYEARLDEAERQEQLVGRMLITIIIGVPIIAAALYFLTK